MLSVNQRKRMSYVQERAVSLMFVRPSTDGGNGLGLRRSMRERQWRVPVNLPGPDPSTPEHQAPPTSTAGSRAGAVGGAMLRKRGC